MNILTFAYCRSIQIKTLAGIVVSLFQIMALTAVKFLSFVCLFMGD